MEEEDFFDRRYVTYFQLKIKYAAKSLQGRSLYLICGVMCSESFSKNNTPL